MGKSPQVCGANMVLRERTFDIEIIQREMLNGAKKHIGDLPQDFRIDLIVSLNAPQEESDKTIDFEILTEIQHYGGQTNLIDFTTDYFIALFFACDGHHDEDGRVILQKTEEIQNMMEHPSKPTTSRYCSEERIRPTTQGIY